MLICLEVVTISAFRLWEEWVNVFLGAWLIAAPWILRLSSMTATINFVIMGLLVAALALYELWQGGRVGKSQPEQNG